MIFFPPKGRGNVPHLPFARSELGRRGDLVVLLPDGHFGDDAAILKGLILGQLGTDPVTFWFRDLSLGSI